MKRLLLQELTKDRDWALFVYCLAFRTAVSVAHRSPFGNLAIRRAPKNQLAARSLLRQQAGYLDHSSHAYSIELAHYSSIRCGPIVLRPDLTISLPFRGEMPGIQYAASGEIERYFKPMSIPGRMSGNYSLLFKNSLACARRKNDHGNVQAFTFCIISGGGLFFACDRHIVPARLLRFGLELGRKRECTPSVQPTIGLRDQSGRFCASST